MKKCIKLLSLLFILLFTVSVKAKTLTEAEYKELKIDRAYILCDYVFDMKNGFNPTLRDFLLASQTCPKNNVTIYEIKYSKDINGNDLSGTWAWYERYGVFPTKTMKRKEKKKFRMRYRDLPF